MKELLLVTTSPNRVKTVLEEYGKVSLHIIEISRDKIDMFRQIRRVVTEENIDMLITYRCPYVLPSDMYDDLPSGGYNIHPSLLPKYKGLNPWRNMFENRETQGGVTIHNLSTEVDSGEIVIQRGFEITGDDSIETAREKADELAAKMVLELLD